MNKVFPSKKKKGLQYPHFSSKSQDGGRSKDFTTIFCSIQSAEGYYTYHIRYARENKINFSCILSTTFLSSVEYRPKWCIRDFFTAKTKQTIPETENRKQDINSFNL